MDDYDYTDDDVETQTSNDLDAQGLPTYAAYLANRYVIPGTHGG